MLYREEKKWDYIKVTFMINQNQAQHIESTKIDSCPFALDNWTDTESHILKDFGNKQNV